MIISFAVAASENNVIGKDNQLLWSLPNDMKFFKNTTWGFPVIMGRKTFESLGKPLAGRTNIVITRQQDYKADGVIVVSGLQEAMKAAEATDAREAFVIGGGEIFRQALPIAEKIVLTRVHAVFEGDAFFPELDPKEWEMEWHQDFEPDEKHAYSYSFQIWRRRSGHQ
jgi:dihydrofolate reductase